MEVLLMGTAAAEGIPAPFCLCDICNEARITGGKNRRTRANAFIDNEFKIDWGPDTVSQLQQYGRHAFGMKTLLFTHEHVDHLQPSELFWIHHWFTQMKPAPVEVFGNRAVIRTLKEGLKAHPSILEDGLYQLRVLNPGESVVTAQGDEIWAVPGDHIPECLIPRIRRKGKTILYGHDTGLFPDEAMAMLNDGITIDLALFDSTLGNLESSNRGHMNAEGVIHLTRKLRDAGIFTEKTRVIATHFSHNGKLNHEGLVEVYAGEGIEVAYDGMVVNL